MAGKAGTGAHPSKLTQHQVDILYDILDRFDRICTEIRVQYVMSGGTALGAIRHKGLIPWDDDGDLIMFAPQFYNKSMDIFTLSQRHGLFIQPFTHANGVQSDSWYKIYLGEHTIPNVDIFVLQYDEYRKQWIHIDQQARTYFPTDYLTRDQVSHIYRTPFGPLNLWMFSNHIEYFNRNYGNDWSRVAWDGYDHVNDVWKPARTNERHVDDYRPSLPSK
jgi:lipopolysaccharide cholinephosphotransferase